MKRGRTIRSVAWFAWQLARIPVAISMVFTWEWAAWWAAALIRFATTGETITITRDVVLKPHEFKSLRPGEYPHCARCFVPMGSSEASWNDGMCDRP